jgi:oxysterol-binding protein-related protein 8
MFCRGVIIGTLKFELGDHAYVRCPELGLMADIDFKTKGYFGGTYNAIGGVIKDTKTDKVLYELSGHWHEKMYIKDVTVRLSIP